MCAPLGWSDYLWWGVRYGGSAPQHSIICEIFSVWRQVKGKEWRYGLGSLVEARGGV